MALKTVQAYKTADGTLFEIEQDAPASSLADAMKHEQEWLFRCWCNDNICIGGEWSAQMVAEAILDHWRLERIK